MIKWWTGYLLALFALLGARLPADSEAQEEPKPSSSFRIRCKGEIVEISTKAARLPWSSERITEIGIQQKEEALLRSSAKVVKRTSRTVELRVANPEVREHLLSGTGRHSIVMGSEKMIIEGDGRGGWKILGRQR